MTHKDSPAEILTEIILIFLTALLCMIAIPIAIIGILVFNVYDTIKDALKGSRLSKWFYGRRA